MEKETRGEALLEVILTKREEWREMNEKIAPKLGQIIKDDSCACAPASLAISPWGFPVTTLKMGKNG